MFFRTGLPNLVNLAATVGVSLAVVYFQKWRIELPVRFVFVLLHLVLVRLGPSGVRPTEELSPSSPRLSSVPIPDRMQEAATGSAWSKEGFAGFPFCSAPPPCVPPPPSPPHHFLLAHLLHAISPCVLGGLAMAFRGSRTRRLSKLRGSSRVGSGGVVNLMGRVGSGQEFFQNVMDRGRDALLARSDPIRSDPIRSDPIRSDPIREKRSETHATVIVHHVFPSEGDDSSRSSVPLHPQSDLLIG